MKEEIKKKYCLEIDKIIKNEDSTDANVYLLKSLSKKYIMKLYNNEELRKNEMPYLKTCALKWIDYIMNNNQFDSSTTESFVIRKNLIETEVE